MRIGVVLPQARTGRPRDAPRRRDALRRRVPGRAVLCVERYIVMAYIVMAYIFMAYIVMTYLVMAEPFFVLSGFSVFRALPTAIKLWHYIVMALYSYGTE